MVDPNAEAGAISQDEKNMAMLACVLGIFTWFVGPLVIFLIKKDQSRFVAYHALQATIFEGVMFVLACTAMFLVVTGLVAGVLSLIFMIIAAMAANKGEWYEIPVVGKFAKQQVGITA